MRNRRRAGGGDGRRHAATGARDGNHAHAGDGLGREGAVAGAGYIDNRGVGVQRRVGGRPTAMQAEIAAATLAVLDTPLNQPLTVITDSMVLLWIIRRWTLHDFGYWIDQEIHRDILCDLLARL